MLPQQTMFDYAALDNETRIIVQQRTTEIKSLMRRAAQDIIDIGQKLIEVKARLGYGQFGPWLKAEFEWSERTARSFMQVATQFKSANFADLRIAPSALYLLSAPSTPESARDEALARAEAGEPITYSTTYDLVQMHKENGDAVEPFDNAMAIPSRADLDQDWDEWEAQATEPGHRDEPLLSPTFDSKSNEWYTPAIYIEAARSVLGQIDLDPASCEEAQRVVQAGTYYTIDDDGLSRNWAGCVWLNPPYGTLAGKSVAGIWIAKLIEQYQIGQTTAAIILVNAATEHKWFAPLWEHPICFTNHRIKFISARDDQPVQPLIGSAFAYLGPAPNRFAATFRQFGPVVFQYKDNGHAS